MELCVSFERRAGGRPIRVFYAFDLRRTSILLIGTEPGAGHKWSQLSRAQACLGDDFGLDTITSYPARSACRFVQYLA